MSSNSGSNGNGNSGSRHATHESSSLPAKYRQFEADDQRWTVHELRAPVFDRRGGNHLVFEAEAVIRRVRIFPTNWHELSDEELYALTENIRVKD